jgi:glycosyltransferase involved in cell wall biosynthesis
MPSLIGACDLVVFPAREMTGKFDIPMFLAECLAMGKPLIVSDIPPLSEIVEDGAGVVTSADDDGGKLAEMILHLLGDIARLRRMSETARKLAIARYDARVVAQRYADIYSAL